MLTKANFVKTKTSVHRPICANRQFITNKETVDSFSNGIKRPMVSKHKLQSTAVCLYLE